MKNNIPMQNIFSKATENRTQNGVKSYLSPTLVLSPILIFAFLTLGVGQAWAAEGEFYNMYVSYMFGGVGGSAQGDDKGTGLTQHLGTLSSGTFTITGVYLKCWDKQSEATYRSQGGQLCYQNKGGSTQYISCNYRKDKNKGDTYEWQNSSPNVELANYENASGSYRFECWGQT